MMRMLTATYALSVSCTPMCAIGEPSGPIENGTTYIMRPRIAPEYKAFNSVRISDGSRQLLFGPASTLLVEQINVRSSTRATSAGSECAQYELGRLSSSSLVNVPARTRSSQRSSYSFWLPSHQYTSSGCKISAHSATHFLSATLFDLPLNVLASPCRALIQGATS